MERTASITTNLWFDREAEEAANFYTSIFKGSIGRISRYGKAGQEIHHMPEGSVMTVEFEINGRKFVGLNGGPVFKFNESVSFIINCETQEEVDHYWDRLSEGGDKAAQQCGWLKDKYGLSWQVVPTILPKLMTGDKERAGKAMDAMMQMKKLDIAKLEEAYNS
jgi:predicted 3-demethylubiquinone-9 3-methyltransferase (glyoxalase superfamily)